MSKPQRIRQILPSLSATRFESLTLEVPVGGDGGAVAAAAAAAAAEANLDLTFLNCRSLKGSAGGAASSSRRCFCCWREVEGNRRSVLRLRGCVTAETGSMGFGVVVAPPSGSEENTNESGVPIFPWTTETGAVLQVPRVIYTQTGGNAAQPTYRTASSRAQKRTGLKASTPRSLLLFRAERNNVPSV